MGTSLTDERLAAIERLVCGPYQGRKAGPFRQAVKTLLVALRETQDQAQDTYGAYKEMEVERDALQRRVETLEQSFGNEAVFYVRCGDELHCRICAWLNRLHSPECTVPRVEAALRGEEAG